MWLLKLKVIYVVLMYFYGTGENLKIKRNAKFPSRCPEITIVNIFLYFRYFFSPSTVYSSISRDIFRARERNPRDLKMFAWDITFVKWRSWNPIHCLWGSKSICLQYPCSLCSTARHTSLGKSSQEKFKDNSLYYIVGSGQHREKTQQGLQFFMNILFGKNKAIFLEFLSNHQCLYCWL